jgi:hypothetical protein
MQPLNISLETAKKLAEQLNVPVEHVLHMPRHILLARLAALAGNEGQKNGNADPSIHRNEDVNG